MNLKHRLINHTTATVQLLTDTSCIFSDEVSTSNNCLSIIEANSKVELWHKIRDLAKVKAENTRFKPAVNLIDLKHKLQVLPII